MADTFTCGICGETFEKAWSDEEAQEESMRMFGEVPPSEQATVCEDCWLRLVPTIPSWARADL